MDKPPSSPTNELEAHEVKTGRSSILKPIRPRTPFQELSFGCNHDEATIRQRRVSFSGKNIVKEFCSKTHSQQITHVPTYEESFQISDTSESNLNSTCDDSSINQSFFAGKLEVSEESNVMVQSMEITSSGEALKNKEETKNERFQNLEFENCDNRDNSANMSLTTALPCFKEVRKRNHCEEQESDVPLRYANRCSLLYNMDSSGMDFTEVIPSAFTNGINVKELETSMEMTNVSRLPVISLCPKSEMELTEAVPAFQNDIDTSMEMTNVSRLPALNSPACLQPRKSLALDFSPAPETHRKSAKPSFNLEISESDLTETIQKPRRKTKSSLAFAPHSPLLEESFTKIHSEDMDLSIKPEPCKFEIRKSEDCSFASELKNDDMDLSSLTGMKFRDSELSIFEPKIENECPIENSISMIGVKDMDFSVASKKPDESCLAVPLVEVTENDGKQNNDSRLEQTEILDAEKEEKFCKSKFSMQTEEGTYVPKFSLGVSLFNGDDDVNAIPCKSKVSFGLSKKDYRKSKVSSGFPLMKCLNEESCAEKSDVQQNEQVTEGGSAAMDMSLMNTGKSKDVPQKSEQTAGSDAMDMSMHSVAPRKSLGFALGKEIQNEETDTQTDYEVQHDPRKSNAAPSEQTAGSTEMDMSNMRSVIDPRKSKASLGFPHVMDNEEATAKKSVTQFDPRKSCGLLEQTAGSDAMDMSMHYVDPRKSKVSLGLSLAKEIKNEESEAQTNYDNYQHDPRQSGPSEQTTGSTAMDMSNVRSIDSKKSKASLCFAPSKEIENEAQTDNEVLQHDPRKFNAASEQTTGSTAMDMSNVRSVIDPRKSKASFGFPLVMENEAARAKKSVLDPRKSSCLLERTAGSDAMDMSMHSVDPRKSKAALGFALAKDIENEVNDHTEYEVHQHDPRKSVATSDQTAGNTTMDMSNVPVDPRKSLASFGFLMEDKEARAKKSVLDPRKSCIAPLEQTAGAMEMSMHSIDPRKSKSLGLAPTKENEDQIDPQKSTASLGFHYEQSESGSTAMDISNLRSAIDARKSKASFAFSLVKGLEESDVHIECEVPSQVNPLKSEVSLGQIPEQLKLEQSSMYISSMHSFIDPRKSKVSLGPEEPNTQTENQLDPRKSKVSFGFLHEQTEDGSASMDMSNVHSVDARKSKAFGFPLMNGLEKSDVHTECEVPPQIEPLKSEVSLGQLPEQLKDESMDMFSMHSIIDPRKSKVSLNPEESNDNEIHPQINPRNSKIGIQLSEQSQAEEGATADMSVSLIDPQKSKVAETSKQSFSEHFENISAMDVSNTPSEVTDHPTKDCRVDPKVIETIESLSINETCDKIENSSPTRKERISTLIHSPIHHEDSPKLRIKRKKTIKPPFSDDSDSEIKSAEVMDVSAVLVPEIEKLEESLHGFNIEDEMDSKESFSSVKLLQTPKASRTEIVYDVEPPYEIRMKNIDFMREKGFIQKSESQWKYEICPFFFLVVEVPLVEISNRTAILKVFSWCNPLKEKDPHLKFVVYNFNKMIDLSEMLKYKNVEQIPLILEPVKCFWKKILPIYNSIQMLSFKSPFSLEESKITFSVKTLSPLVNIDVIIDLSQWETYLGPDSITVVKRRGVINEKIIKCLFSERNSLERFSLFEYVDSVKEFCRIKIP